MPTKIRCGACKQYVIIPKFMEDDVIAYIAQYGMTKHAPRTQNMKPLANEHLLDRLTLCNIRAIANRDYVCPNCLKPTLGLYINELTIQMRVKEWRNHHLND